MQYEDVELQALALSLMPQEEMEPHAAAIPLHMWCIYEDVDGVLHMWCIDEDEELQALALGLMPVAEMEVHAAEIPVHIWCSMRMSTRIWCSMRMRSCRQ